jgi:biotin carboxyl carrier protein
MTLEIEVGSRTRLVSVSPGDHADRYFVTIDGRRHEVQAARIADVGLVVSSVGPQQGPGGSADKTNDGKEFWTRPAAHQVFVTPAGSSGDVFVMLEGRTAILTVNGARRGRAADTTLHVDGGHSVTAPMPGRIVRVLVGAGDEVTAGQGVVVVEAMKMENELRAPKAGRVKDVSVSAGTSVEAGKVLVVIE